LLKDNKRKKRRGLQNTNRKKPTTEHLRTKGTLAKGEVKAYYSELTDIARNYIEEAIDIPAMESTTCYYWVLEQPP
jgi:hypothetical protein